MALICNLIMFTCVITLCAALLYMSGQRKEDYTHILNLYKAIDTLVEIQKHFIGRCADLEKEIIKLKAERDDMYSQRKELK